MPSPLPRKFTLNDLRAARTSGQKIPMLTCYDFSTARLMQQAGVPALLAGDSAANVILGYETTVPVSLDFMIEITAAVQAAAAVKLLSDRGHAVRIVWIVDVALGRKCLSDGETFGMRLCED